MGGYDAYPAALSTMEQKILTKHPQGKSGFNISKQKYDVIRAAIMESLRTKGALTHTELAKTVKETLKVKLEGSLNWYLEVVKLDLEARKVIERMPRTRPQSYRLAQD